MTLAVYPLHPWPRILIRIPTRWTRGRYPRAYGARDDPAATHSARVRTRDTKDWWPALKPLPTVSGAGADRHAR